jgi:DNA-binding FadR family transcriptional regulator
MSTATHNVVLGPIDALLLRLLGCVVQMPSVPNSDTVPAKYLRRTNLPEGIASDLRRQIGEGALPTGTRLPGHRQLATLYHVSVGSVREAISMLVSAGLVETRAGRGTFVAANRRESPTVPFAPKIKSDEVFELTEAREVIETELAALAAARATPAQVAELERCLERMRAASTDPSAYPDADVEFHIALAHAAGNRYLLRAMLDIRSLLREDMVLGAEAAIRRFGDLDPSVESHARLARAVAARDADRARDVAREIVSRNQTFVLGLYAMAPHADREHL